MFKLSFLSFFSRFLFIASIFFIVSCNDSSEIPSPDEEVPEGQIWAEVDGTFLRFDDFSGIAPQDANSYASSVRLMSIYRAVSSGNIFGTLSIKLSPVNLDEVQAPQDFAQNVIIIFNPQPNVLFTGRDGAMQLQITSIEGDVVKGTFSGTVRGNNNSNETFRITNGKFNVKLERF
jgi:hypothetical protein